MAFAYFSISTLHPGQGQQALNSFLASARVIDVTQQLVGGDKPHWTSRTLQGCAVNKCGAA